VSEKVRGALILLGFALIAAVAFFWARHWQSEQLGFVRIDPVVDCDLRAGPCRETAAGGSVTLSIAPSDIPLMKTLRLAVVTEGLAARDATVEIRGLNMDMGLNRTVLSRTDAGRWEGETILPICSQRRMEWEAAVRVVAEQRIEVPFRFHTSRP